MSGTIISARNGRHGVEVPDAWAHDTYGDEVYWLECDGCRGSVIVDYYDHGNTDLLQSDTPFGDVKYLADTLRSGITADGMDDKAGVIFAGVGRTRKTRSQYAATIFRVASPQSTDGRMYVAELLLAYPDVMEVGNITASAIATTEDAKRRESEVMAKFGNESVLRLGDKVLARQEDPYLRSFTGGEPMYAFERVEFDKQYPHSPLTQIRRLVARIVTSN